MVRARKSLGQHFLHHRAILERIATALDAPPGSSVLEVGPGQGALTRVLVERSLRVTAIEKDPALATLVGERVPEARVLTGDALELDWPSAVGAAPARAWFVIGNIPYNITSPLLARALTPPRPVRIVFLVQEEVADRVVVMYAGKIVEQTDVTEIFRYAEQQAHDRRAHPRDDIITKLLAPTVDGELQKLTKKELQTLAAEKNVELDGTETKDRLIELLQGK